MKRFLAVLLMLAILLTGLTVTANAATAGWKKDGDVWTYVKADGTLAENEWIKDGGKWYYFIGTAMAQNKVFTDKADKWYAADKNGAMVANGWFGGQFEAEKWDGTKFIATSWYYAGANGELARGWKKVDGKWYYFEEDTESDPYMYASRYEKINGKWYAFKVSGEMVVGWGQPWLDNPWATGVDIEWLTDWVYGNADGSLAEGWKKIDGKWYFFWPDGPYMARNTVVPLKGNDYDFDSDSPTFYGFAKSGAMIENAWFRPTWNNSDGSVYYGNWYYFGADGAAKKGWFQDKGKWYYLHEKYGYMETGLIPMSDGKVYYLDETTGAMATGWKQIDNIWYYFKDSGAMTVKEWVKSGSAWYYLKEDGEMAKDEILTIDGKPYKFDANGVWVP